MSPAFWVPQGARPIPIYMEACAADPTVFLFEFFFLQHISLTPLLSASYLSLKSRWCFPCSFCFPSAWFCASCDILWSHLGCLSVTCNLPASSNDSFRNLHIIVPIFLKRLEHVTHTSSGSLLSYDIPGTALAAVDIMASKITVSLPLQRLQRGNQVGITSSQERMRNCSSWACCKAQVPAATREVSSTRQSPTRAPERRSMNV